jgi:hypothetical protein
MAWISALDWLEAFTASGIRPKTWSVPSRNKPVGDSLVHAFNHVGNTLHGIEHQSGATLYRGD